jgi:UDP-N-acetylmuramoylalanine--D-glutamate ligase
MLYEVLQASLPAGRRVWFGGNVGRSLLGDLDRIGADDVVIMELSSFQLETIPQIQRSPQVAVIINVWPNHLDRHGDFESYLSAKLNILRFQRPGDLAVIGAGDSGLLDAAAGIVDESGARLITVSEPSRRYDLRIPGDHNQLNSACAGAVALCTGVDDAACRARIAEFAGLPHRLQHVATIGGVDYYNDSKSTTPRGTVTALASLDRSAVVIVGGQDRAEDLAPLIEAVLERARTVVCMGPCGSRAAAAILAVRGTAPTPHVLSAAGLAEAVQQAGASARPGDVVVLSPGAPSYDEFANYEQRGHAFAELVRTARNRQ